VYTAAAEGKLAALNALASFNGQKESPIDSVRYLKQQIRHAANQTAAAVPLTRFPSSHGDQWQI
jgi:hypothetical protein